MRLHKSTTIMLDIVLALLIVILAKSLIVTPRTAFAGLERKYLVETRAKSPAQLHELLNEELGLGWRLHSVMASPTFGNFVCIFEKTE